VISIPQNGIKHDGMSAFFDSLPYNTNLRELNINDNFILTADGNCIEACCKALG
jgi:hypothetical protein